MALEDLAMFRAIPTATVFYPSDAVSTQRAVELAANTQGICFIRTSRPNVAIIYNSEEPFVIGKAKVSLAVLNLYQPIEHLIVVVSLIHGVFYCLQ